MIWFVLRSVVALVTIVLLTAMIVWWLLAGVPDGGAANGDFLRWLGHLLVGNFGLSATGEAVGPMLAGRLAITVPLALLAMPVATLGGCGLGWLAALRPGTLGDRIVRALGDLGAATPSFWLGMILVLALASGLRWLPTGGFVPWQDSAPAALSSLILPALALAAPAAAALALEVRIALVAAADAPAVLGAQARGATRQDAVRRSRRAGLLTLGRSLARQLAAIVAGTVIVENVFYLPGLGRLILDAVGTRDLATLRGGLVMLVLLSAATLCLTQIAFGWLDPRRRAAVQE
jgi:peptide/nickel transport system permease protein